MFDEDSRECISAVAAVKSHKASDGGVAERFGESWSGDHLSSVSLPSRTWGSGGYGTAR